MKLWKGKEMEGSLKGTYTLFIGSPSVTFNDIDNALEEDNKIKQLYFGAGGCTKIDTEVVMACLKQYRKGMAVALEIDINRLHEYSVTILKRCALMVTFYNNNMKICEKMPGNIQIKLQVKKNPKALYVNELTEFINTDCKDLEGKKYIDDVVIK